MGFTEDLLNCVVRDIEQNWGVWTAMSITLPTASVNPASLLPILTITLSSAAKSASVCNNSI